MPVLRIGGESSLGSDLGSLGQALSNAFNPKTRAEAYALQQRMMLEQLNYQAKLRELRAKDAARQQWSHIVPPDKMGQIENMIETGASYDQIAKAAAQFSGHLIDENTPEADRANRRYLEQIGVSTAWSDPLPVVAGPNTAEARRQLEVQQGASKKGAELTAEQQVTEAQRQRLLGQMVDSNDPAQIAKNRILYAQAWGKEPDYGIPDAGPISRGLINAAASEAERLKSAGTKTGEYQAGGYPANTRILAPGTLQPVPGTQQAGTAPAGAQAQPQTPAQSPAGTQTPTGDFQVRTPSLTPQYAPGTPELTRSGPITRIGPSPQEEEESKRLGTENFTELASARTEGIAANQMLSKLEEAKMLTQYLDNQGSVPDAIRANVTRILGEHHVYVGDRASVQKTLDTIFQSELPAIMKAAGVQRVAGPELSGFARMIAQSDYPAAVIYDMIGRQQALAELQKSRGDQATAIIADPSMGHGTIDTFRADEIQRQKDLAQRTNDILENYQYPSVYAKVKAARGGQAPVNLTDPLVSTQPKGAPGAQPATPQPQPQKPAETPAPQPAPQKAEVPVTPPPETPQPGRTFLEDIFDVVGRHFGGPSAAPAPAGPVIPAAPAPPQPAPVDPGILMRNPDGSWRVDPTPRGGADAR